MENNAEALRMVAETISNARQVTLTPLPIYDMSDGEYLIKDSFTKFEKFVKSV